MHYAVYSATLSSWESALGFGRVLHKIHPDYTRASVDVAVQALLPSKPYVFRVAVRNALGMSEPGDPSAVVHVLPKAAPEVSRVEQHIVYDAVSESGAMADEGVVEHEPKTAEAATMTDTPKYVVWCGASCDAWYDARYAAWEVCTVCYTVCMVRLNACCTKCCTVCWTVCFSDSVDAAEGVEEEATAAEEEKEEEEEEEEELEGGQLSLTIRKAVGLAAKDRSGTSDPYVVVKVGDQVGHR